MAFETSYINQWLLTATKGKVTAETSWFQDRLKFSCHDCGLTLTTSTDAVKADGTVDYGLQEFVKLHAHVGGHKSETLTAYENILKIAELKAKATKAKEVIDHVAGDLKTTPTALRDKVLTQPTGRKFR
jgi:hypothetical protein